MENFVLKGGRVIDPYHNFDRIADVLIENGKIKRVGHLRVPRSVEVIDVKGKIVCPGLIDMHVHSRVPGQEKKENFGSLSLAAIMGGYTSLVCMADTKPVIDNVDDLQRVLVEMEAFDLIKFYQVSAVTKGLLGKEPVDLLAMKNAGAVAASDDGKGIQNVEILLKAMNMYKFFDLPLLLHCEDSRFDPFDEQAEFHQASMSLKVAEELKLPVHLMHVSTAKTVQLVREAKARGVNVSCETSPHHISLTQKDFRRIGSNAKMNPPLRRESDRQAVIRGLVDGTIGVIATDHAPHTLKDKGLTVKKTLRKNFSMEKVQFGVIGLETAVPVVLTTLSNRIQLMEIIRKMTINPAKILGLKNKGTLRPGSCADITVIDLNRRKKVEADKFQSLSRNCPWDGKRLQGWPWMTIVGGHIRMKEGILNI